MPWKAYLRGDALDMQILRGLFRNGDVVVSENANGTFLTADRLDVISEVSDRHREAERILTRMNGVTRTLNSSFRPVELVGRYDDEGGHVTQIVATETMTLRSHIEAAGVVVSGGGENRGRQHSSPLKRPGWPAPLHGSRSLPDRSSPATPMKSARAM